MRSCSGGCVENIKLRLKNRNRYVRKSGYIFVYSIKKTQYLVDLKNDKKTQYLVDLKNDCIKI